MSKLRDSGQSSQSGAGKILYTLGKEANTLIATLRRQDQTSFRNKIDLISLGNNASRQRIVDLFSNNPEGYIFISPPSENSLGKENVINFIKNISNKKNVIIVFKEGDIDKDYYQSLGIEPTNFIDVSFVERISNLPTFSKGKRREYEQNVIKPLREQLQGILG